MRPSCARGAYLGAYLGVSPARGNARIGEMVGQRNLAVTANTYSHVLLDESEVDYAEVVGDA